MNYILFANTLILFVQLMFRWFEYADQAVEDEELFKELVQVLF